jgi:hypothetical protein
MTLSARRTAPEVGSPICGEGPARRDASRSTSRRASSPPGLARLRSGDDCVTMGNVAAVERLCCESSSGYGRRDAPGQQGNICAQLKARASARRRQAPAGSVGRSIGRRSVTRDHGQPCRAARRRAHLQPGDVRAQQRRCRPGSGQPRPCQPAVAGSGRARIPRLNPTPNSSTENDPSRWVPSEGNAQPSPGNGSGEMVRRIGCSRVRR